MDNLPRLMVMGHGRHGKDTVCEILRDNFGYQFISSSDIATRKIIMPKIRKLYEAWEDTGSYPINQPSIRWYDTPEECFEDRHTGNNRAFWYDTIVEFEKDDATALGKLIFEENNIYCGIRNKRSYHALRNAGMFYKSIWVDRSDHEPPEPTSSNSIEQWMADFTIDNNGTLAQLGQETVRLMERILADWQEGTSYISVDLEPSLVRLDPTLVDVSGG